MAQRFSPVGSDAWTSGKDFTGRSSAARIEHMQKAYNEDAFIAYASSLRDGRTCTLSSKFSVGTRNFVKKITFDDEVEWIVRLRMPPLEDFEEETERLSPPESDSEKENEKRRERYEMQSELDTMEFLLRHSAIPVPKVHGYDLDNKLIGVPFSIMDYIPGSTAEKVSSAYPGSKSGIPAQYAEKFWRQIAKTMLQLAFIRLPKIGSIIRDPSNPYAFVVGPLVYPGTGPYASTAGFYNEYPLALANELRNTRLGELAEELVEAFQSFVPCRSSPSISIDDKSSRGFALVNYDLGSQNVIVDSEFNILAVIDLDSVMAMPDAGLYNLPDFMGVEPVVPGTVRSFPWMIEYARHGRQSVQIVEEVGREQSEKDHQGLEGNRTFVLTSAGFFSKEAVAFRSLICIHPWQGAAMKNWLPGLKWLSEHSEAEVAQFYEI
ncbi:hypothetical protein H2201_006322 [Coniosporium apollinis]|uniref:Aminoglycoside phosphotransferase domain-containing protein n=1 Tax=Coniosporium apollinis TaxID=61459 RepID=A0ABQ9NM60_9PEZI|nr:hypothetical protein H2201_006322 [Coniosporium apollinis]